MAVQRLYPQVQVTIGPWIENGFYYDFDTSQEQKLSNNNNNNDKSNNKNKKNNKHHNDSADLNGNAINSFSPKDLKKIMKEMRRIINADYPIVKEEVTRSEARRRIEEINEKYKVWMWKE